MWLQGPAVSPAMEPWGIEGHALHAKGNFIAECLYRHCVLPDGGQRLRKTAAISPGTSLKQHAARKAFKWAAHVGFGKKFFTLAACREGVKLLLRKEGVEVPFAGLSMDAWIESQAKVIMKLAARARTNSGSSSLRFRSYYQAKFMDWEETLPQAGPWVGKGKAVALVWSKRNHYIYIYVYT